ncbi:MAG: hypothetical protein RL220_2053 [Bacteroidota bacterium]|jgi:two-component system LytT family response regulator
MINALIIDDEDDARSALASFLKSCCPQVNVLGEANGVQEGYKQILLLEPDLIFLDIHMDDGTGFDLLEKFRTPEFSVIFITAYDNHAIRAFRYAAIDYLLKPIDPDELTQAVMKVKRKQSNIRNIDYLNEVRQSGVSDRLALSSHDSYTLVKFDQIVRLESDSNYTHFFLTSREKITVPRSLREFEDILPAARFFRTHQSHIINLSFVKKFIKEDGGYVLMEDGSQVLVARRRKDDFIKLLTGHSPLEK